MAQISPPPLVAVIRDHETRSKTPFTPTRMFYETVGINRIRFSKIKSGKIEPTRPEIKALAVFFEVPVDRLI